MNLLFKKGEELFLLKKYEEAFEVFRQVSEEAFEPKYKADAYNMMGAILLHAAPNLAQENEFEEGVEFFRKALILDPENLGAQLNVLDNFGESYGCHKDIELAKDSHAKLVKITDQLSENDLKMLERKFQLILKLEGDHGHRAK